MAESSSFNSTSTSFPTPTEAGSSTPGSTRSTSTFFTTSRSPSPTITFPSSSFPSSVNFTSGAAPIVASLVVTTALVTETGTVIPTESVNRPGQTVTPAHSSNSGSGLSTSQIAAIGISVGVFLLIVVALVLFLYHRRSARTKTNGAPSKNVDVDTMEKYGGGGASEYMHLQYRHEVVGFDTLHSKSGAGGLSPHATSFNDHSRRSSRYSSDFAMYRDSPPSPFVNGEIETTEEPLKHAVSLGDARPFSQIIEEAQRDRDMDGDVDTPELLPNPHESPRRSTAPVLAPLVIPTSYNALGRKATNGMSKRVSRRSSKNPHGQRHTYQPVNGGGDNEGHPDSDVDTESMYSQASAYTMQSMGSPHEPQDLDLDQDRTMTMTTANTRRLSNTAPLRFAAEKHDSTSTIRARDIIGISSTRSSPTTPTSSSTYPNPHPHPQSRVYTSVDSAPSVAVSASASTSASASEHGTETTDDLSRENTAVVAKLLQSRVKKTPERSASLVSHIERKGSIRPAGVGVRAARRSQAGQGSRVGMGAGMGGLVGIPQDPASPGWSSGFGSGQ